jgi:thiamine pyrophosphokinase
MIRHMKPYLVAIALLLFVGLAGARSAKAIPITYSTTGSFNGSGNTITFGSGGNLTTITFTGVNSTVDPDPNPFTFASLGQFQTTVSGSGATITPGTTFTLTINQTVPSAGTGSFPATLTGTIDQNTSTGLVTFTVTSVTINNVTYTLTNNPLPLVPPATNNGITTVQAQISAVPEPTTMLLLGTGLAGVAASVRKRRKGM